MCTFKHICVARQPPLACLERLGAGRISNGKPRQPAGYSIRISPAALPPKLFPCQPRSALNATNPNTSPANTLRDRFRVFAQWKRNRRAGALYTPRMAIGQSAPGCCYAKETSLAGVVESTRKSRCKISCTLSCWDFPDRQEGRRQVSGRKDHLVNNFHVASSRPLTLPLPEGCRASRFSASCLQPMTQASSDPVSCHECVSLPSDRALEACEWCPSVEEGPARASTASVCQNQRKRL